MVKVEVTYCGGWGYGSRYNRLKDKLTEKCGGIGQLLSYSQLFCMHLPLNFENSVLILAQFRANRGSAPKLVRKYESSGAHQPRPWSKQCQHLIKWQGRNCMLTPFLFWLFFLFSIKNAPYLSSSILFAIICSNSVIFLSLVTGIPKGISRSLKIYSFSLF